MKYARPLALCALAAVSAVGAAVLLSRV